MHGQIRSDSIRNEDIRKKVRKALIEEISVDMVWSYPTSVYRCIGEKGYQD